MGVVILIFKFECITNLPFYCVITLQGLQKNITPNPNSNSTDFAPDTLVLLQSAVFVGQ